MNDKPLRRWLWVSATFSLIVAALSLGFENSSLKNELNALKSEKLVWKASIRTLPQGGGIEIQCPSPDNISKSVPVQHQQTRSGPTALESALLPQPLPITKPEPFDNQSGQTKAALFSKAMSDARIPAQERPQDLNQTPGGSAGSAAFKEAIGKAFEAARQNNSEEKSNSAVSPFGSK